MAPALLDGVASLINDIFVTVETVVFTTQTVTGDSNAQPVVEPTPTAAAPATSTAISSVESSPTSEANGPTIITSTSSLYIASSAPQPSSTSSIEQSILSTTAFSQPSSTQLTSNSAVSVSTFPGVETSATTIPVTSAVSVSSVASAAVGLLTSPTSTAPVASSISDATTPSQQDRRPALIGGIIGAIIGLALIAIVLIFCFIKRRRRKRHSAMIAQQYQPYDPYPPRPQPYRLATGMSEINFGSIAPLKRPPPASVKSFKSANGNLIHISLNHFTRPFSEQESYRDLMEPGLLRCTNPDRSLPVTPNLSSSRLSDPFNRTKAAAQRISVTEREIPAYDSNDMQQLPVAYFDGEKSGSAPRYSTYTTAPSFRSYPSIHSTSPRVSRWMAEPPVPPLPAYAEKAKPKRPALSPLHSAATRTLSSIGNALRLSSSKATKGEKSDAQADYAHDASWRASALSDDPFDLDYSARRSAAGMLDAQHHPYVARPRNVMTYDGT